MRDPCPLGTLSLNPRKGGKRTEEKEGHEGKGTKEEGYKQQWQTDREEETNRETTKGGTDFGFH